MENKEFKYESQANSSLQHHLKGDTNDPTKKHNVENGSGAINAPIDANNGKYITISQAIKMAEDAARKAVLELESKHKNSNDAHIVSLLRQAISNKESVSFDPIVGMAPIDVSEIDPDDYVKTPVEFFAWCHSTNIWDDIRQGRPVKTPYRRPIRFKHLYRVVKTSEGRGKIVQSVCRVVLHSKKEIEFVRSHTLFGIKYFETSGQASSVDIKKAAKLAEVYQRISKLSPSEINFTARQLHSEGYKEINLNTLDVDEVRRSVANALAEKEIKDTRERYEKIVLETSRANSIRMGDS